MATEHLATLNADSAQVAPIHTDSHLFTLDTWLCLTSGEYGYQISAPIVIILCDTTFIDWAMWKLIFRFLDKRRFSGRMAHNEARSSHTAIKENDVGGGEDCQSDLTDLEPESPETSSNSATVKRSGLALESEDALAGTPMFNPPVYRQRYDRVTEILSREHVRSVSIQSESACTHFRFVCSKFWTNLIRSEKAFPNFFCDYRLLTLE